MFTGVHTLLYSHDHEATRAFLRDVLRLPHVDTGGGWLIFRTGPSETAAHPRTWEGGGTDQLFDVALMCDDLGATMADLAARGAEFEGGVDEQPWGHVARVRVPGAGLLTIYEPTYPPVATADL